MIVLDTAEPPKCFAVTAEAELPFALPQLQELYINVRQ